MNARAERRRAERETRKEAGRLARWLRDVPEPTMAAARRLAAGMLGQQEAAADAPAPAARRLTVELLAFAATSGATVERAAGILGVMREQGLATITDAGGIVISEEQSARMDAIADEAEAADDGEDPADLPGDEPAPHLQLTKKGTKAIADTVWAIAEETGHSVEEVALSLRELHESGGAKIDEDGTVTLTAGGARPEGEDGDSGPFVEAVRASIGARGAMRGRA